MPSPRWNGVGRAREGLLGPEASDHGLADVATARALEQGDARSPVLAHRVDRLELATAAGAGSFEGLRSENAARLGRRHGLVSSRAFGETGRQRPCRVDKHESTRGYGAGVGRGPERRACRFYKDP